MAPPAKRKSSDDWETLKRDILKCRRCPRLNAWRSEAAADPPRRYQGQIYHARPVPSFGDPKARILVVGLAPAAHGANRTGRMFTGDRSGEWLYRALYRAGLANRAESTSANDGLRLKDVRITNVCRCAPPENKPTREEVADCAPFLDRELDLLGADLRVIVVLGSIALKAALQTLGRRGATLPRPRPKFGHGVIVEPGASMPRLIMSYHPSQQNTFTGKLTEPMFDVIWTEARKAAEAG
jgi:uracil-DNA glycosylase family 4